MEFQNNDVTALDKQTRVVLFYNSECSHCREIYPKVFWHNVLHLTQAAQRIQTINVKNPNNAHYVTDYGIQETPTFMKIHQSDSRIVTTNFKDVNQFINQ
ncbi:thioredoxin domain-containing protein [Weissella confusa]|uniref:thioredoxin domain-containing protein n=1 Tax=Weissella confusa TaxID=1583 RepID=UPI0021649A49|nr:thioredoxin domain-containing protein [Weissella confusa]